MTATQPAYTHDCESCTFLGSVEHNDYPVDLYHCAAGVALTVIARYSDNGPDYNSGTPAVRLFLEHGRRHNPLVIAYERAKEAGLDVDAWGVTEEIERMLEEEKP